MIESSKLIDPPFVEFSGSNDIAVLNKFIDAFRQVVKLPRSSSTLLRMLADSEDFLALMSVINECHYYDWGTGHTTDFRFWPSLYGFFGDKQPIVKVDGGVFDLGAIFRFMSGKDGWIEYSEWINEEKVGHARGKLIYRGDITVEPREVNRKTLETTGRKAYITGITLQDAFSEPSSITIQVNRANGLFNKLMHLMQTGIPVDFSVSWNEKATSNPGDAKSDEK